MMAVQQRDIDRSPESARQAGAGVDQLMGIGIGHLPDIEAQPGKDQQLVGQAVPCLCRKGPDAQGQQREMHQCKQQAKPAPVGLGLGQMAAEFVHEKDQDCDRQHGQQGEWPAIETGQCKQHGGGQAGGGVPKHLGLTTRAPVSYRRNMA